MSMLDAAIKYALRGWQVIPLHEPIFAPEDDGRATGCTCRKPDCKSIGKHPRTQTGLKEASGDVDQIRRWWAKWPAANIGIVTGAQSKLYVVDQDDGGELTIRRLCERFGEFPETNVVRTGSGGRHWYFRLPDDLSLANTQGTERVGLGPHVDTRGDGGYVVAPPSTHRSGNDYAWETNDELAEIPSWLVAQLRERATQPTRVETLKRQAPAAPGEAAQDAYFVCHNDVVEGGEVSRHDALRTLSFRLAIQGVAEDTIYRVSRWANARHCLPPKEEAEVDHLVAGALAKEEARTARARPPEPNVDKKSIEGKLALRDWKATCKGFDERTAAQALFAFLPVYLGEMRLHPERAEIEAHWYGGEGIPKPVRFPVGGDVRELQRAVLPWLGNVGFFAKRAHPEATDKLLLSVLQEMAPRMPVRDAASELALPVQLVRLLRSYEVWVSKRVGDAHTQEMRTTLTDAFDEVANHANPCVVAGKQGIGLGLNKDTNQKVLAVNFSRFAATSGLPFPFRGMAATDLQKILRDAPGAIAAPLKYRWLRNAADVRWYGVDLTAFDAATAPPGGGSDATNGTEEKISPESVPTVPSAPEVIVSSGISTDSVGTDGRPRAVPSVPEPSPIWGRGDAPRPHERPHWSDEKNSGFG